MFSLGVHVRIYNIHYYTVYIIYCIKTCNPVNLGAVLPQMVAIELRKIDSVITSNSV